MRIFAVARSAATRSRSSSASIMFYAGAAVAPSVTAVTAVICVRRAVSSSGSILWNVALVVTILTLI